MTKDESLKISVKLLLKIAATDNINPDITQCIASILEAEASKNYGMIYTALEELKHLINKLQIALKNK